MAEKKTTSGKSTKSTASKSTDTKSASAAKKSTSTGKSTTKANVNRVAKAVKKYDTDKSFAENKEAVAGVVSATATSAKRASNKKQQKIFIAVLVILIIAIVAVCVYGYFHGWFDGILGGGNNDPLNMNSATYNVASIKSEQLSMHFLELGNNFTGDSVYIKAGDTDILIDAGSRQSSAKAISDYVDQYCTDGILEYVIVTHAHQDHIAGFVGTKEATGIFEKYECKNIIQFAKTNADSAIYNNYCEKRDAAVAKGANLFTALDCVNNANGAKKVYNLTADGSIKMEILYQEFYENKSSDENNYSVCALITQGEHNYLFTGDLEKEGEKSLVKSNPNLPEVELYKGGHHGSYTAGNNELLSKIKPKCICICCCAGSIEYTQNLLNTFPAQDFIDRIAPYTKDVYVTTVGSVEKQDNGKYKDTGYASLNGNIVFACTNNKVTMYFSKSDIKLKDTEWFKNNRTCPDAWK